MNSGRRRLNPEFDGTGEQSPFRDSVLALEYRKRMIESIVTHARSQGLDANNAIVDRHYVWFLRWYEGVLATGYLMGRTGVKYVTTKQAQRGE